MSSSSDDPFSRAAEGHDRDVDDVDQEETSVLEAFWNTKRPEDVSRADIREELGVSLGISMIIYGFIMAGEADGIPAGAWIIGGLAVLSKERRGPSSDSDDSEDSGEWNDEWAGEE